MKTINLHFSEKKFLKLDFTEINSAQSILVQVFSGICDRVYLDDITSFILQHIPNAIIIGATTDGEIIDGEVSSNKVVLSISTFEKTALRLYTDEGITKDNSFEHGEKLAKFINKESKALIVFSDGLHTDGDLFLNGIKSIDEKIILAGGMAGDNMNFKETFVISNEGTLSQGVVAVSLESDELIINTDYKLNLMAIGNELKITHAVKNRVYTINNIKADEIYRHYLGDPVYKELPKTGFEFPLIRTVDGVNITRSVIARHDDGSLEFAGNINTGEYYHLGFANVNILLDDSSRVLENYEKKAVESIFIYSCMVRKSFFQDAIVSEIKPYTAIGSVSGFFTYGEFYKNAQCCALLNQTMTSLALSESVESEVIVQKQKVSDKPYNETSTLAALHNLISVVNHELKEYKEKFDHLAYYDSLTSLANREKLQMHYTDEVNQISATGNICALLFLDLNKFKYVNDTHGHDIGDKLLKKVAKRLKKCVRNHDVVSRVGGDEFVILLSQIEQEEIFRVLHNITNRIVNTLEVPFKIDSIEANISTSIGVSIYGLHGTNIDDLLKFADNDMYADKKSKSDDILELTKITA